MQNVLKNGKLHPSKSTEHARAIVGFASANIDCTQIPLKEPFDVYQALNDFGFNLRQGINGPIWALIAVDTTGYELSGGSATRDALIDYILDQEVKKSQTTNKDGGWVLAGFNNIPDPDITGMALLALAPYYHQNYVTSSGKSVREYVERALVAAVDHEWMTEDGDVNAWGSPNPESTVWLLVPMLALGKDPNTYVQGDKKPFVSPTGKTFIDGILRYRVANKGFKHTLTSGNNWMSTDQACYGLIAYLRHISGRNELFDYGDRDTNYAISTESQEHARVSFDAEEASRGQEINFSIEVDRGFRIKKDSMKLIHYDGKISFDEAGHLHYSFEESDLAINMKEDSKSFIMPGNPVRLSFELEESRGADLNLDGVVNGYDVSILLASYNKGNMDGDLADLNGDNQINGLDLALLLVEYNTK